MKKSRKQTASGLACRLHYPEEEKRFPWLPLLLDAYAIADTGVTMAIRDREKKEGKRLACGKGCGTCCVDQADLPLYPHEIVGIYWFVTEKLPKEDQERLKPRFAAGFEGPGCPFLLDDACSIHPLRPTGCRQFNVFTRPCAPGEDPYFTRRGDVLEPDQAYLDRVFAAVLPIYNLKGDMAKAEAVRVVRSQIMNLRSYDWSKLSALIDQGEGTR